MRLYLRLLCYVRPYIPRILAAVGCIILSSAAQLYVPWIIKDVIDNVLAAKDIVMLNSVAAGIVVVYVIRGFAYYGQTYLMAYVGQRVVVDIRTALYKHLQRLSMSFYDNRQTGTIMSYVTNDVGALQTALVDNMINFITESVILIGSLFSMFYIHWQLTLLTLVTLPLVAQAIKIFGRKLRNSSRVVQERVSDLTSVLQETVSAVRVIKSFAREDYETNRFSRENEFNFAAQMKNSRLSALLTPVVELLATIGVTAIIWYGGHEVIKGHLTSGFLIAFLIYAINISNPIRRLSSLYANIQRALAAAQRVFDILDIRPDIEELPDAQELPSINGYVEFRDVVFHYKEDKPALDGISLEAMPGQMVAIVGPSGAGKTTIANLIPRFYDITSGAILIDGFDIRTVTLKSLREQIGIVPQETVLFNGTIYDNILYGRLDASEEDVIAAAKAANAHNFIMQMPDGYKTHVGERGAKLSGGQRQRIAIARAILKNPRILILDEATSALDTESEKLVQEAIDELMVGRTSFVIAHRLSTIRRADIILVLEKGKIVERGNHDELIALGGVYSKLYQVQFSRQHSS